jgi:GNAT superfamily N-acetyltransferase
VDGKFIHSSWHTAYWKTSARKYLTRETYDAGQDRRIDRLIFQSHVLVAFFPEVPDEILGWACMRDDVLHYVYVKAVYRRRGIATGLVAGRASCYTHATDRVGEAFAASIGAVLNPYRLESP